MTTLREGDYTVIYEKDSSGVLLVQSVIAQGNFIASYGGERFASEEEIRRYIRSGGWGKGSH